MNDEEAATWKSVAGNLSDALEEAYRLLSQEELECAAQVKIVTRLSRRHALLHGITDRMAVLLTAGGQGDHELIKEYRDFCATEVPL